MGNQQLEFRRTAPPAAGRVVRNAGPVAAGVEQREARLAKLLVPSSTPPRPAAAPRPARLDTLAANPTACVLVAHEFERCLQRERSLADRGTRRFCVLQLRHRAHERAGRAEADGLAKLAGEVSRRVRSTDLVGRPDAQRIEILLSDTELAGAQVVAVWVEQVETRLGLALERTLYVYPCVSEPGPGLDQGAVSRERSDSNGPSGHASFSNSSGARPPARASTASNGTAARDLPFEGRVPSPLSASAPPTRARAGAEAWPTEDLWPRLCVPTPLWKRALDIVLALLALVFLAPLFAAVALAIRLESRGPVIFKQLRAGRGARPFVFYKFRSMSVDAEDRRAALAARNEQDGPIFKIHDDPRVTRVGRQLRRWSLDELPQLWNVLKGDISLVGPRSPTLDEVAQYERWHRRRLCVTGGITCIWQVSGRSQISFRDWMRLDMRYVACRDAWLDLRLLALTLPAVISARGAC